MDIDLLHTEIDPENRKFELKVANETAFIEYILNKQNVMYLVHTEVPKSLEGQGVGSKLVRESLRYLEDHDLKLAPLCPFVAAYVKKHEDEYGHLLAPGYNVS